MNTTITPGEYYGGTVHCCICARACMHTTPPSYCLQHTPSTPSTSTTTTIISGTLHPKDCGSRCACYWRGRRDEAKES